MARRLKEDVKMQTVLRGQQTQGQGRQEEQGGPQQLALWEREILASQEVKRKVRHMAVVSDQGVPSGVLLHRDGEG